MRILLLLTTLCLFVTACGKPKAPAPSEKPAPTSSKKAPQRKFDEIFGAWKCAPDPTGAIKADPIYSESRVTLSKDSYVSRLDSGPLKLEGPYKVLAWGERGGRIERVITKHNAKVITHFDVRRDASGKVVGFVLSETEDKEQQRYYVRAR